MTTTLALAPLFWKGLAVTICGLVLFVGTVYIIAGAVMGLRMAYLVVAVSFFGWMIILSSIWVFGAPGTLPNLGPRATEPHWQVYAAGADAFSTTYPETADYDGPPWKEPTSANASDVDAVKTAIQKYLAAVATEEIAAEDYEVPFSDFGVTGILFTDASDGTQLSAGRGFYQRGGPQTTVFLYFDQGNVPVYSYSFFAVSILGFLIHLPFLDRAEKKRKAILTGGTAPPWFGPA